MWLYGAVIALSAFLLFEVQPVIGKMILPWFGGSAAVWTTTLMFFQITLLAGYVYAYWSIRYLSPRMQGVIHLALLVTSLVLLPIVPSPAWKPLEAGDPTWRILMVLAASVGLPYFILSTTGPLLQAWYVAAHPGAIPYRLFAISNTGSMLALLSFPFAVEPFLTSHTQAISWSVAYVLFAVICGVVAAGIAKNSKSVERVELEDAGPPPSFGLLAFWTALPACASALLLAITNHITQNIAPIPFLWVLTLSVYLLSFILCFENERVYYRPVFLPLLAVALPAMSLAIYASSGNVGINVAVPLFAGGLFVCCMVWHGEVARLKPHPRYLTRFYLMLALGGAIGGLFVAVAAPHLFSTYVELPVSLAACSALIAGILWRQSPYSTIRVAAVFFALGLAVLLAYSHIHNQNQFLASVRNFYGVLRVTNQLDDTENSPMRKLVNGTIVHGSQLTGPGMNREPTSYYGHKSGIGRIMALADQRTHVRVGVVGLGAGVLATYCRTTDEFRFYEINPLDVAVAKRYFTFLKDCPGDCKIVPGDARLQMERQPPQNFDILAVDAFSSDAIPIHLLTREAFAVYIRHLAPDGILAVHVSNRYLDLVPIVARDAAEFERPAFELSDNPEEDYLSNSTWMLVGGDTHLFVLLGFQGAPVIRRGAPQKLRTWTDDYSNLFQILRW